MKTRLNFPTGVDVRQHNCSFTYWHTWMWHMPTSLHILLRNDSAKHHILGCGDPWVMPMTPKFELVWDFYTMHLAAKFYHPMFNRLEVIVMKNRHCWKHPPHITMLHQWVIIMETRPKSFGKSRIATRHDIELICPLHVLAVQCPLETSPITQPWEQHIHTDT